MGTGATASDNQHHPSASMHPNLQPSETNSAKGMKGEEDEQARNSGSLFDSTRAWPSQANHRTPGVSIPTNGNDDDDEDNNNNGGGEYRFGNGEEHFSPRQFPPEAHLNSPPNARRTSPSSGDTSNASTSNNNSTNRRPEPVPSPPPVPRERPAWLAAYSEPAPLPPAPELQPQPPQPPPQLQLPTHEDPAAVADIDTTTLRAVTTSLRFENGDYPTDGGLTPTTLSPSSSVDNGGVGFGSNDGPLLGSRDGPSTLTSRLSAALPVSSSSEVFDTASESNLTSISTVSVVEKNCSSGSSTNTPVVEPAVDSSAIHQDPSAVEAQPAVAVGPAAAVLAAVAQERSAALRAMGVVALVPDGGSDSAPPLDPSRPRLVNLNQDPLFR